MKSRKGSVFGIENFSSIVLALIAIIFLGLLAVKLYNLFVEQDKKNAQAFINSLTEKIEAMEDRQNNTFAFQGVEGWVLVGWNKNVPIVQSDNGAPELSPSEKPQKCFDKNCLCICKGSTLNCQEEGYCRFPDRDVSVNSNGNFDYTLAGGGTGPGGGYYHGNGGFSSDCLLLENDLLLPINIDKQNEKISISYNYGFIYGFDRYGSLRKKLKESNCQFIEK